MSDLPVWRRSVEGDGGWEYLPVAFHFQVKLMQLPDQPGPVMASFQEVSGLEHALDTEDVQEGGENRFVHQLPLPARARRLLLKRGLVQRTSAFMTWCRRSLQGGLSVPLRPITLEVRLLAEDGAPLLTWVCSRAYPVRWTLNGLDAMRNELAIEEIELAYQSLESPA